MNKTDRTGSGKGKDKSQDELQSFLNLAKTMTDASLAIKLPNSIKPPIIDDDKTDSGTDFYDTDLESIFSRFPGIESPSLSEDDDSTHINNPNEDLIKQLLKDCDRISNKHDGMSKYDVLETFRTILISQASTDDIQSDLFDAFGFDEFDLISNIIQHRLKYNTLIKEYYEGVYDHLENNNNGNTVIDRNQKFQFVTKEDRNRMVMENQIAAKNAPLRPEVINLDSEYPHVYSNQGTGNILSEFGTKYALPMGTERINEQVCKFYFYI